MVKAYLIHWHTPEWCAESVAALLASTEVQIEVAVVNNGGELDLPAGVRILQPGHNLDYARAANVALRDSAGSLDLCS
jgi:GT2 family glycosyltransferase